MFETNKIEGKRKQKVKAFTRKKKRKYSALTEEDKLQNSYQDIQPENIQSFADFPLSSRTQKALHEYKYIIPTEIQKESIGYSLKGEDILGAAKTGSGKTLAFLIPVLEHLYCKHWTRMDGIGALIITPTRELAYQIFETLRKVGKYHEFSAGLIIGGKDLKFETKRMDQCNIVICTPGRILQHMDENPLFDCSSMKILVLDEADKCLDMGFERTMNSIIENLPPHRQTLLFSATQTKSVKDLARLSLKDPRYVSVHEDAKYSTPAGLTQSYIVCELHDKMNFLWSFIKNHQKQKILVFMASCKQVKYMYEAFTRLKCGAPMLALYGTLHQQRRMTIYDSFCRKQNIVLLATDIAARGLDFPEVNWVVQLDCPETATEYIHRAGRTARYHKSGESLLVLLPSELKMLDHLTDRKIPIEEISVNSSKLRSVQRSLESSLARDQNLKASAQRAFVAYVKSIFLMKDKQVFDVTKLDTDSYARSLGLAIPPRIRFLQKWQKARQNKEKSNLPVLSAESADSCDEEPASSHMQDVNQKANSHVYNFYDENEDEEHDFLQLKRKDHDLEITDEDQKQESLYLNKRRKTTTKAALAKKMMKKKILPNKKVVFNEEGEVVPNRTRDYMSEVARQYAISDEGGIDIEAVRQVLKEEDKYDKQFFRMKIKEKHRKERKKLKEARKKEMKIANSSEEDDSDSDENTDLSFLPDFDKIDNRNRSDNVIDDNDYDSDGTLHSNEEEEGDFTSDLKKNSRRDRGKNETKTSKNNELDTYDDLNSYDSKRAQKFLHKDEEIALQLMNMN